MKKPKLKKLPKKPGKGATLSSLENYFARVKEVQKDNREKLAAWKKAKTLKEKIRKARFKKI